MARSLTTAYKEAVTAGTVRPVILIIAEFDSETLRFWNGYGDFDYDGETYTGTGNLLGVSEITETQNTEARGVKFTLSGLPSSLISTALQEDYQDRPIKQIFAPLDYNNNVIAEPFTFFSGKTDVMNLDEGGQSSSIEMSAESDLITLLRVNERRHTPEDQKLKYSTDTFFDNVASLQSQSILWGQSSS